MSVMHIADAPKDIVHATVILTPKPEHLEEVCTALCKFGEQVEANEPETLVFSVTKADPAPVPGQSGPTQVVITIVFRNEAAAQAHRATSYHKEFISHSKDEDKLVCPPVMKSLTPVGGYMRQPPK